MSRDIMSNNGQENNDTHSRADNLHNPSKSAGTEDASPGSSSLTPFPRLTGRRSDGISSIVESTSHQFNFLHSDLQASAAKLDVSPQIILQVAWAFLLSLCTGSEQIAFLSLPYSPSNQSDPYLSAFGISAVDLAETDLANGNRIVWDRVTPSSVLVRANELRREEQSISKASLLDLRGLDTGHNQNDRHDHDWRDPVGHIVAAICLRFYGGQDENVSARLSYTDQVLDRAAADQLLKDLEDLLCGAIWEHGDRLHGLQDKLFPCIAPLQGSASSALHSQFEENAKIYPDRIAIDFRRDLGTKISERNTTWTYGELNEKAEIFAYNLRKNFAIRPNQVVPTCMERCPELYLSVLGILKAGAGWCPIDPSFPVRRRQKLIARTDTRVVVVNNESPADGFPTECKKLNIATCSAGPISLSDQNRPSIKGSDLAYLIWTSGTTGEPKGVPIHHEAALTSMRSLQVAIPSETRSGNPLRCLQFARFTFDVFIQDLFYTWGLGGTVISSESTTVVGSFAELATKAEATHAHLTPAFAASVPRLKCPTLEVVTMIGEKLIDNVTDEWSQGIRLFNTYGPAETAVVATVKEICHGDLVKSANIGYPLPSVATFVLRDGKPVETTNCMGELALSGPQLSEGYWCDEQRSKGRFVWNDELHTVIYLTGDTVRRIHNGSLEFVGRDDDLVKIHGVGVDLGEITSALDKCHPLVQQVVVLYLEDQSTRFRKLVAFLSTPTLTKDHEGVKIVSHGAQTKEITTVALQEAQANLPKYMVPAVLLVISKMPQTPSAKIDREVLRNFFNDADLKAWDETVTVTDAARSSYQTWNGLELKVSKSVARLTGVSEKYIGRQTVLRSIGVDSIYAMRLVSMLHAQDIPVSNTDLLQCANLGDLLDVCSQLKPGKDRPVANLSNVDQELRSLCSDSTAEGAILIMPCLPLQEALLSETYRETQSYWRNSYFSLPQQLDRIKFEACWKQIAKTTEALRIAFLPSASLKKKPKSDSAFLQLLMKSSVIDLVYQNTTEIEIKNHARARASEVAHTRLLDQFARPPWAVTVFVLETRYLMMITIHHAVCDESSLQLLIKKLSKLYSNPLPSDDFRAQQQLSEALPSLLPSAGMAEMDMRFWEKVLSPMTNQGEDEATWPEIKHEESLDGPSSVFYTWRSTMSNRDLAAFARRVGVASVASVMRLAWACILCEYLEAEQTIVFGETWSVRGEDLVLSEVIGPLISVVPVPINVEGNLASRMRAMDDFLGHAKEHMSVHPRKLRKLLGRGRDSPLYPAVFNFVPDLTDDAHEDVGNDWQKMEIDPVDLVVEHPIAFNVSMPVHPEDDYMTFELVARRSLMDSDHLEILSKQLDAIIDVILFNPEKEFRSLSMYLPISLQSIARGDHENGTNDAWVQDPTCWVDHFADRQPHWTAVEAVEHLGATDNRIRPLSWTFYQLQEAYKSVAENIVDLGIEQRFIAVCTTRSLAVHAIILAIMHTNNVYLPIAEDLPIERKKVLLEDSGACLLFTSKQLLAKDQIPKGLSCKIIMTDDIEFHNQGHFTRNSRSPKATPKPLDNAYLLYTSGSTGVPKGVLVSRGNLMSFIEAITEFINKHMDMADFQGRGKWLGMASYAFDVHLLEMFFAWRHGMATVTAPRALLLDHLQLALRELRITHASFVPSLVDHVGLDPKELPDLRYMSLGGEKLTKKAIATWAGSHVMLANAYGPTEVTIGCCFKKIELHTSLRNIGSPLAFTTAYVLRSGSLEPVMRGTAGELCLTGDLVANGYLNRPDVAGFVEDLHGCRMYRTGDQVRLMSDDTLEFLGRKDDQIKIRGQRIELGEVVEAVRSAALANLPSSQVDVAALVAQHPSLAKRQLVAFVSAGQMLKDSQEIYTLEQGNISISSFPSDAAGRMQDHCRERLPAFMAPDHILQVPQLPKVHQSRKVDLKMIHQLFSETPITILLPHTKTNQVSGVYSLSEAEEAVVAAAERAMTVDEGVFIGPHSNLYDLGLDSLNAISLVIELEKSGFQSSVTDVLKYSLLKNLASSIHKSTESNRANGTEQNSLNLDSQAFGIGSEDVAAVLPCLPLQETLLASTLGQITGKPLYINHVILEMPPGTDCDRILSAWNLVAADNQILRTYFIEVDHHFVQVVLKSHTVPRNPFIIQKTARTLALCLRDEQSRIASDLITKILREPPIRLTFAKSEAEGDPLQVQISLHHALYDDRSFNMILDELFAKYHMINASAESVPHTPLTALIDYLSVQKKDEAEAFWKSYLHDYKSVLIDVKGSASREEATLVNKKCTVSGSTFQTFATSIQSTPPMIIQAIFGIALAQALGRRDIVFGVILSGRLVPVPGIESILGPCVATIPQRVAIPRNLTTSVKESIMASQPDFVNSLRYQHTPLKDIHRWVGADQPLFDSLFTFTRKSDTSKWMNEWHEVETYMSTEFPLAVEVQADIASDEYIFCCKFTTAFGGLVEVSALLDNMDSMMKACINNDEVELGNIEAGEGVWTSDSNELENPPSSQIKDKVRRSIEESIHVPPEELHDTASFFALGIDSVLAVSIAKRLRNEGFQCSSADIMRYASIQKLTSHLSSSVLEVPTSLSRSQDFSGLDVPLVNDKDSISGHYLCTPLQSSMLTQTLSSDGTLYVHQHPIRIPPLGFSELECLWTKLIQSCDILRTTFHFHESSHAWVGAVHTQWAPKLRVSQESRNLTDTLSQIREEYRFSTEEDFSKPPWRLDLVGDSCILSMHHSLYDAESLHLLLERLSAVHNGQTSESVPDFCQIANVISKRGSGVEDFWLPSLGGFQGTVNVLLETATTIQSIDRILDLDLAKTLSWCRETSVTLQTAALLSFGLTLAHFLKSRDIVTGQVVNGRSISMPNIDKVLGPLFNTIPVRLDFGRWAQAHVETALHDIQTLSGLFQQHQHASLSEIQRKWRQTIATSDASLIACIFVFQKSRTEKTDGVWSFIDIEHLHQAPTEYPVNFMCEQRESCITVSMNSTLIPDLGMFVEHFERTLVGILDRRGVPLGNFLHTHLIHVVKEQQPEWSSTHETLHPNIKEEEHQVVADVLANLAGMSAAKLERHTNIFSVGLDSLSAIKTASMCRKRGIDLSVADVIQGRTIDGILQRVSRKRNAVSNDNKQDSRQIVAPLTESEQARALANAGVRSEDTEEIFPCLAGQIYHLARWLKSNRVMGEATWTFIANERLDQYRLLDVWRALRKRHQILRTSFTTTSPEQAVKIVLKPCAIRSDAFACIQAGSGPLQLSLVQTAKQELARHFDLFTSSCTLTLISGNDADMLLLSLHHALYDAVTIELLLQDLVSLYRIQENPNAAQNMTSRELMQTKISEDHERNRYWTQSLSGCTSTIVQTKTSTSGYFFAKREVKSLGSMEQKSRGKDAPLSNHILIAFSRALANWTSTASPVFGLFQAGRSGLSADALTSSLPFMNVTPFLLRDAINSRTSGLLNHIAADLAERIPFEQDALAGILRRVGWQGSPLFNSFLNIIPPPAQVSETHGENNTIGGLLEPWQQPEGTDGIITPTAKAVGRTAVDDLLEGTHTEFLAEENLFVDVRPAPDRDVLELIARCDCGAMNVEDCRRFLGNVVEQLERCLDEEN